MTKLSEAQRKALTILGRSPGIRPADFAAEMWPDSPGWKRPRKCGGYGVHPGGGMYVAAGQYLGKLKKLGLVDFYNTLTPAGRSALQEEQDG